MSGLLPHVLPPKKRYDCRAPERVACSKGITEWGPDLGLRLGKFTKIFET